MEETTAVKRLCHSLHTPPLLTYLPLDVIVEILCRLPVKLLLQLCCVCKSWNHLILKDHKFAIKHLGMSIKRHHLIITRWIQSKDLAIISYPFDSVPLHSIVTSNGTQLDYSHIIRCDWRCNRRHGLVASCDGLLCFHVNDNLVSIYNPCIRKVKNLYVDFHVRPYCEYAFGYDPFIDNYKVIVVFSNNVTYDINHHKSEVKVHTLGTDSWRSIKGFPPSKVPHRRPGIFVSGTVNWLTYYNSNGLNAIVSLHLGKETYQEIPLPDYGNFNMLSLGMMRDCLCIFSRESDYSSTDVWLMKEYSNKKDSWIKLIRLPYFGDFGDSFFTKILYIFEDNNHVLLVFKELTKLKLVVYDCKNETIMSSKIEDLSIVESNVYVESLISP
ncbi:hypothetical protein TSUD_21570 [Trifolium subterraneum]|uniref:F-box domain-containing protein n=1 Tax=Trifolium subterraneum TaxID=3900 RepID=A0A2Z6MYM2_TRISU|nr:hypothetical protein TSUD_21570 [Trifolium subterraneum]